MKPYNKTRLSLILSCLSPFQDTEGKKMNSHSVFEGEEDVVLLFLLGIVSCLSTVVLLRRICLELFIWKRWLPKEVCGRLVEGCQIVGIFRFVGEETGRC